MPALVDLLDQFFFSDAPGAQAREALVHAWQLSSGMSWDALYAQSLDDALSEELPHLSAYTGRNTPRPTRPELVKLLRADLGDAGNHLLQLDRNSGTFLTELARAMQAQRLIVINQHNLFTDEYRQILLNLFDHAHIRFKANIANREPEFSGALASATGYDTILIASISNFLARAFNAALPSLPASMQPGGEIPTPIETSLLPIMSLSESVPEPTTFPKENERVRAETPERDEPSQELATAQQPPRAATNRLRVLVATPADVLTERAQLSALVSELDTQARARFGLELVLVNPSPGDVANVNSAAELADIFIGVVWLQFGSSSVETTTDGNAYFAGTEQDFGIALEQGSERNEGWLRTVVYRSIRPPLDLLHLNVAEYTRVQQFFERASAYGGEDLVRVYNDSSELLMDARARLDAWMYNYAGDVASALTEYGKTLAVNGQTADALTDFEQAILLYRELDRPELEMALWSQVGALHRNTGNREQAANAYDTALRLANRLEDDEAAANALHEVGLLQADMGDWRAAQRAYQQARTHLKPDAALYRTIIADEISALTEYGNSQRAANELEQAGDAYRDALALAQGIDDAGQTVALYSNIGQVAAQRGEYQPAIEAFSSALNHLDTYSTAETRRALYDEQADSYAQLAKLAHNENKLDEAEKAYAAALAANRQGNALRTQNMAWFAALGEIAAKQQSWERAIDTYGHALALLDTPADVDQRRILLSEQGNAFQQLGATHFGAQKLELAASAYRDALAVYQELDARDQQGDVLTQLGAVSAAQSRWQEANAYFTQAIPRLNSPATLDLRQRAQRAQAISLSHIGDEHRDAQEWGQAEIAYVQARGNLEQLGSSSETAELLVNLGIVTSGQARWQEALAYYQQARARLTAPEQAELNRYALRAEAGTLRQLADLRRDAGDRMQAQATYRQMLELAEELQDSTLEAEALYQLGRVAADAAHWDEAVDSYDRALTRLEGASDAERAPIQRDQLEAYEKMGERERAALHFPQTEMAYRSALTLAQGLSEREREAELLNTLGLVSIEQENWEEALVNLRRALGIYNLMPSAPEKSRVIWNIGRAQRGQKRAQLNAALERANAIRSGGEFSEATADLETALQLSRELGDAHLEGIVLADMGHVAAAEQNWDAAITTLDSALAKLSLDEDAERRTEIQSARVNALRQRSTIRRETRQWAEADADLSIALEQARTLNDAHLQGELVYESGLVAAGQARWNDAINLYSAALDALPEAGDRRNEIEGAQAEAYRALGNSEANGQNWQGAEASFRQALTLQHNRGDIAAQAMLLTALGDVAMRQGEWQAAVDWLNQARPLTEQAIPERLATLDGDLERANVALKRELQVRAEAQGDARRAAREFETASASYAQALGYADELQDKAAQAELNAKLGFIATERGEHQNALAYYRVAAGAYEAPEYTTQRAALVELQAQTLQDLGNRAGERGRWNDALALYQESIALLDAPTQAEQRNTSVRLSAITLQNLGDEARTNLDWTNALDAYRRAAGLYGVLGATEAQHAVRLREADVLTNVARQNRSAKEYGASLEAYRSAADLLSEAQDTAALDTLQAERVMVYHETGDALAAKGNWNDAFASYQDGFALAQAIEDRPAQAELLYQLGRVQAEQGQWDSALAYYQAARGLTDAPSSAALRTTILRATQHAHHTLGDAQRAAGDLEHAQENYNGALSAALELDDRAAAGELYFILGMLDADTRAWDKALGNYAVALDQMDAASPNRSDVVSYQAVAFQEWGDMQRAAGQFDAASESYASALQRADELDDAERAGEILYRQGLMDVARGDWQAALDTYALANKRLPVDSETRALLGEDVAFATRAVQRNQLDAQLQHAEYARQELQWEDAATAYRAALGLTHQLADTATQDKTQAELVSLFADKAAALRTQDLWDESADAYRESLLLAREYHLDEQAHNGETALVALATDHATSLRSAEQWDAADKAYRDSIGLAQEFGLDSSARAQQADLVSLYADKAALLRNAEDKDAADAAYRQGITLAQGFGLAVDAHARQADLVSLYADKAALLRNAQDWDAADAAYRQGITLAQEFGLDSSARAQQADLVSLYADKAASLRNAQDWDGADKAYRQGITLAQEFGLEAQAAALKTSLASLYVEKSGPHRDLNQWSETAAEYRAGLAVAREFDLHEQAAAFESNLVDLSASQAASFRNAQDWDAADMAYRQGITLAQEFGLEAQTAALKTSLASLYVEKSGPHRDLNQWSETAAEYRAGLAVAREFDLHEQAAAFESNLVELSASQAASFRNAQDWDAADATYREGITVAREFNLEPQALNLATNLATLYSEKAAPLRQENQWGETAQEYRTGLAAAHEFNLDDQAHTFQTNLVSLYAEHGESLRKAQDWDAADATYREGIRVAREFNLEPQALNLATNLATLYSEKAAPLRQENEWDATAQAYSTGLAVAREFELAQQAHTFETNLVSLYAARAAFLKNAQDWEAADATYRVAINVAREFKREPEALNLATNLATLYSEKAAPLREQNQWDATAQAYRTGLAAARDYELADEASGLEQALVTLYADKATAFRNEQPRDVADKTYREAVAVAREFKLDAQAQDAATQLAALYDENAVNHRSAAEWEPAAADYRAGLAVANEFELADQAHRFEASLVSLYTEHAASLRSAKAWDAADAAYRQSATTAREFGLDTQAHALETDLATLYAEKAAPFAEQMKWTEAAAAYRSSLNVAREFNLDELAQARESDLIALAKSKTEMHRAAGDLEKAHAAAQEQLELGTEFGRATIEADALAELGRISVAQGQWESARDYFERARPLLVAQERADVLAALDADLAAANDHIERTRQLEQALTKAQTALAEDGFADATSSYRTAYELARGLGDETATKTSRAGLLATAFAKVAALENIDWAGAQFAAQDALDTAREFDDLQAQADALYQLGTSAAAQTHWQDAKDYFAQSGALYESLEDSQRVADTRHEWNRADTILNRQARLATAISAAQTARETAQWDTALGEYRTAYTLTNELGDESTAENLRGVMQETSATQVQEFRRSGDWANAAQAANQQLALAQEFQTPPAQANALLNLGGIAASQRQWENALAKYDEAGTLYASLHDDARVEEIETATAEATREWKIDQYAAAQARGELALENGRWQEAGDAFTEALELATVLNDARRSGESQRALGDVATALEQYDSATERYGAALAALAPTSEDGITTAIQTKLVRAAAAAGDVYSGQQEWDKAHAAFALGLEHAGDFTTPAERAHLLDELGNVSIQQNNLPDAIGYFERALADTTERAPILEKQAAAWQHVGDQQMDAHDLESAQTSYDHSLALYTELDQPTHRAQVLHSIGLVHTAQGNLEGALQAHQQSFDLVQDLDVPTVRVEMLRSIGDAQRGLGHDEAARENYQRALVDADTPARSELEFALGEIAASQAHWQNALTHLAAAETNLIESDNAPHAQAIKTAQANAHANLGAVLYGEGQWSDAQAAYQNALDLDLAAGRTDRDGDLHYHIGLTHAAQSNYVDAIAHYDQAVTMLTGDELVLRDRILAQLAQRALQEGKRALDAGDWDTAESAFTPCAPQMAEASDNFDQTADLWFRLGKIYTAQAVRNEALRAYRRAYEMDRRGRQRAARAPISDAPATGLLAQGEGALERQDYGQAHETLRETLMFAEQAENPQLLGSTLEALANTAKARGQSAEAIDLYARAGRTFAAIEDTDRWRGVSQLQANLLLQSGAEELDANEFADAENLYRRAWLLKQASGDLSQEAETHFGLGRALLAQEKYSDALAELEKADTLWNANASERGELKALQADALEALGTQSFAQASWSEAQQSFMRAATYRDELGQRSRAGLNWQRLAEISAQQNEPDAAVDANDKALARLDTPDTADARRTVLHQQAQVLASVGDRQQQAGEWGSASETYRRALAIAQEQGDLATIAQLYSLLAALASAQEHWDDARTEYQHALEVYEELDQPLEQAQTWLQLGDMHRQATQYDLATNAFQEARELYSKTGNRLNEGAMIQRLGHVQGDREEWDAAIDEYQTALHLYNDIDARRIKPEVYRAMERAVRNAKLKAADESAAQGDISLDAGAWADAELAYRDALDLYAEADERILSAQMQNQVGVALEAQMRFDEALEHYRDALTGFEQVGIPEAQVGVLANMGDVQRSRKLWNKAEAAYREALARNQTLDDPARAAELYNSLGMVREQQDDWDGALEHYQTAVNLFETAGMSEAHADTLQGLARAQHGARQNARQEYKRALEQALAAENFADAGEIYNTLGLMAAEDKQYDEALDYYRQAVTTFERLEATEDMDPIWRTAQGTVLNNIGDASQQIGAWHDADYAYTRALGLAREIGDRESEAILLSNLGVAAKQQAQLPRALDLSYQALESYRVLGDESVRAELLERVGNLQVELGQPNAAETTMREALEIARATNDEERIPRLQQQLGSLAEGRGSDDEALAYYQEALTRAVALSRIPEQKALWKKQGVLYARSNQWEQAERAQTAALELAIEEGDEPLQAELHSQLGQAAAARGDWRVALQHKQNALALYEKFNASREQMELHERIGQAHAALGELTAAEVSYRAALELAPDVPDVNTRALWQERAALAEKHNRWSDAAAHYESARAALPADAAPETKIELIFRRGDAAMHAREWHTADVSYNDALELANVADNRVQYGLGMNRLGLLAQAQRNNEDALEYFQESIEILRQFSQPLAEAHVLNNIARLKLETNNAPEAELFSQAALAIAQALGSGQEASISLYLRGLIALEAQEFDPARRFLNQAIATNPANSAAQLQLGNTLLAETNLTEAVQQAEAAQGQAPDWELGAQTQLTIASLYLEDQRNFKTNLKRTRALMGAGSQSQSIAPEFLAAIELVVRAMEGDGENVLAELNAATTQPARTAALDALRFARSALLALSKSPRRFKGKPTLVTYFTPPKPRSRKSGRTRNPRRTDAPKDAPPAADNMGDEPAV